MTRPPEDKLKALATKWLKGTLSPEEKELIDQWYDSGTGDVLDWEGKDTSEEELSGRLFKNIRKPQASVHLKPARKKWYIPAAASLLIGLFAVFYYSQTYRSSAYLSAAKQITAGKNAAVLTLADGSKINLSKTSNGKLAHQNGLNIIKTADGRLIYELSDVTVRETPYTNFNTIEVPSGGQWTVRLPDGSLVFLNASSRLSYPTQFKANERKVQLEGEAYFEIAADKQKPFRVESRAQVVEVLGTHFNITAYPGDQIVRTTLLEGSIKLFGVSQSALLVPGQQAQQRNGNLKIASAVDLEEVIAWKNGYFKFNDNLESIMNKVARWYNIEVDYEFRPDPGLTFSGKISRKRDLSGILEMLAYNGDVTFKIKGRRVTVTK